MARLAELIGDMSTTCRPLFGNVSGLLDELLSDVTVNISYDGTEKRSYKLHRVVLAGCSSYLHDALINKESKAYHQTLEIMYMSPPEFELILKYMYTGDMCFHSVEELCLGLYAARLFNLVDVKNVCLERLHMKIKSDCGNTIKIAQLDERYEMRSNNSDFFLLLDDTIRNNFKTLLSSELIEDFNVKSMRQLLQMNTIEEIPEINMFRALFKWTKSNCIKKNIDFNNADAMQSVADDLIYLIRYNLIPLEMLAKEVVPSGLLSDDLIKRVYARAFDSSINVPFCTESRRLLDQKDWQLVSTCTKEKHLIRESSQWSLCATLVWDRKNNVTEWLVLPACATETRWQVKFYCSWNGNFGLDVRCLSLSQKFRAAVFRVFAVLDQHPHFWLEAADVLHSGRESGWWLPFTNRLSELPTNDVIKIQIRLHWTELDQVPATSLTWKNDEVLIQCRWKLYGWKSVNSTSDDWRLFSEPFGRDNVIWRLIVINKLGINGRDRNLMVCLKLQHFPMALNFCCELFMNCSLSVWNRQFDEQNVKLREKSFCLWNVINIVKIEKRDPLDMNLIIKVDRMRTTSNC